jgi:hypothetical protein
MANEHTSTDKPASTTDSTGLKEYVARRLGRKKKKKPSPEVLASKAPKPAAGLGFPQQWDHTNWD